MNKTLQHAEKLAQSFTTEHLIEMMDRFEDFYLYFTSEVHDPVRAKNSFKLMNLYLLALSFKELDFGSKWKNFDFNDYPATPDYAN